MWAATTTRSCWRRVCSDWAMAAAAATQATTNTAAPTRRGRRGRRSEPSVACGILNRLPGGLDFTRPLDRRGPQEGSTRRHYMPGPGPGRSGKTATTGPVEITVGVERALYVGETARGSSEARAHSQ